MTTQQPSVGRIVHYRSYGTPGGEYLPEARAAMITEVKQVPDMDRIAELVDDGILTGPAPARTAVSIVVFNPTGLHFNTDVPYSEEPKPGHWSWPPRA